MTRKAGARISPGASSDWLVRTAWRLGQGYLIGLANIVPGVSGGTMALALGVYPRFIAALKALNLDLLRAAVRALSLRAQERQALAAALRQADAAFLLWLGLGAGAAIFSLSSLLTDLLRERLEPTYAFFFGLILASTIFPWKMLRRRGAPQILACLTATVLTVGLTMAGDGEVAREKAQRKAEIKQADATLPDAAAADAKTGGAISLRLPQGREAILLFAGGALAIAAMIMPGISGSFMLLLTGLYFDVLGAVTRRELFALAVFAAGGGLGGLALARLLSRLLAKFRDTTLSFMLGLILGSLWGLWPFKRLARVADLPVVLGNRWPDGSEETLLPLGVAALAVAIVLLGNRLLSRFAGERTA
jgi:putative membrane protein